MSKTTRKLKNATQNGTANSLPLTTPQPASKAEAPKTVTVQTKPAGGARVCLELLKPGAKHVCVAGSFNNWRPEEMPLMQVGNGRWIGNFAVDPGKYEYLFVVDGQWLPDPNAKETVQNPYGGKNSVLTASE